MKIKLDTNKIYLAMAEKGLTVIEIAKAGGIQYPERQSGRPGEGSSSNLPGTGIFCQVHCYH